MSKNLAVVAKYIFRSAYEAVLPSKLVEKSIKTENEGNTLVICNKKYLLNRNAHVAAFGKAIPGMCAAVERIIGQHLVGGVASIPICSLKHLEENRLLSEIPGVESRIEFREGARNNLPDKEALESACMIEQLAGKLTANDILVVLVSGGGSALLPAPVSEVSLEEKSVAIKILSQSGATIEQLNTVRQHLSRLKGGGLARVAYPAQFVASGPTVPSTTTKQDAMKVVRSLGCEEVIPPSIVDWLTTISYRYK